MPEQPEPKRRTFYVVVYPDAGEKEKVTFYPKRSAAEKAANSSAIRPGVVYPVSV